MAWRLSNLAETLPDEIWQTLLHSYILGGFLLGVLFMTFLYLLLPSLLYKYSKQYREKLNTSQRIVVIHHCIEFIMLSLLIIPFSYIMLVFNFNPFVSNFQRYFELLLTFTMIIMVMYVLEIVSRNFSPNPLIIAHHMGCFLSGTFACFFFTSTNLKTISVLVYCITFEFLTFLGLVMYRIYPENRHTPRVIIAGMVILGLTRPLQALWIITVIVYIWDDVILWQAIINLCFAIFVSSLQLYSLVIHYRLWRKVRKLQHASIQNNGNFSVGNNKKNHIFENEDGVSIIKKKNSSLESSEDNNNSNDDNEKSVGYFLKTNNNNNNNNNNNDNDNNDDDGKSNIRSNINDFVMDSKLESEKEKEVFIKMMGNANANIHICIQDDLTSLEKI